MKRNEMKQSIIYRILNYLNSFVIDIFQATKKNENQQHKDNNEIKQRRNMKQWLRILHFYKTIESNIRLFHFTVHMPDFSDKSDNFQYTTISFMEKDKREIWWHASQFRFSFIFYCIRMGVGIKSGRSTPRESDRPNEESERDGIMKNNSLI